MNHVLPRRRLARTVRPDIVAATEPMVVAAVSRMFAVEIAFASVVAKVVVISNRRCCFANHRADAEAVWLAKCVG